MAYLNGPRIVTEGLVLNLDAANVKSFDPVNTNVELLLHMDGANNSTTFTDSSKNGTTVTPYGNAKVSTDQSKFGGSSAYFDGNGDYLRADGNTNFGTGDFTIDCWVMLTSDAKYFSIDTRNIATSSSGIQFAFSSTGVSVYIFGIGGLPLYSTSIQLNTWYHVAFCRKSGVLTGYLNGVAGTPVTVTNNFTNNYGTIATNINNRLNSSVQTQAWFNGFLDELRIVKGKALYTSNFTPERKPYLDGNKIYDLSGNENNGTLVNGPTYSSDNYGVMSFDGSNDHNLLPVNFFAYPSLNTFSISLWFKSSQTTGGTLFGQQNTTNPSSATGYVPVVYLQSNGLIRIEPFWTSSINNNITSTTALNDNIWHNIVTTFNSGVNQLYVDGNYVTQRTGLTLVSYSSVYYYIIGAGYSAGRGLGTHYFSGSISNFYFCNRTLSANEVQQNYNALKGRYSLT